MSTTEEGTAQTGSNGRARAGAGPGVRPGARPGAEPGTVIRLQCPRCGGPLASDSFVCRSCTTSYPVISGVPTLIDETRSVFTYDDIRQMAHRDGQASDRAGKARRLGGLKEIFRRFKPEISSNLTADRLYSSLRDELLKADEPVVLCVGNADGGKGFSYMKDPAIRIVSTDVAISDSTDYAVDAHSLPFADNTFDAVIVQAVLEHVVDPVRCVGEIHRVLRPQGLVLAETPFMQQVHLGRYDFTRFTHLGHRRLFRMFTEIESGQTAASGTALAWSLKYFMTSLTGSAVLRRVLTYMANICFSWLKHLDPRISRTPGSWDCASGFYFFGRRAEEPVTDRSIIAAYRGAQS